MAIAHVQSATNTGSGVTPNATFGSGATAGNVLFATIAAGTTVAVAVGTSGFTAMTAAGGGSGGTTRTTRIFWKIAAGGETAITNFVNSSSVWTCQVHEYSGLNTPHNVENCVITTASTAVATPSVALVGSPSEVLVLCCSSQRANVTTWSSQTVGGSAANVRGSQASTTSSQTAYDRIISGPAGSYSGTATSSGSAVGVGAIAIFPGAAAAAVGIPDVNMGPLRT